MKRRTKSVRQIGVPCLGVAAALAFFAESVAAQTVTTIDLTGGLDASVAIGTTNPGSDVTAILSQSRASASTSSDETSGSLIDLNAGGVFGPNNSFVLDDSAVSAQAIVNEAQQRIGLFDGPGPVDGAAIGNVEVALETGIQSLVEDNTVVLQADFVDDGALVSSVSGNDIEAESLFNAGFNLIETVVPPSLTVPAEGATYSSAGSIDVDLTGSLSIGTTQLNAAFFGMDWTPPVGDPIQATAVASQNEILLDVESPGGSFFEGRLELTDNSIGASTRGQVSESAIILRQEIATSDGPVVGSNVFEGTALIFGFQNSDDIADSDNDFKGEGLHSLVSDSEILATIANGDETSTPTALAALSLDASGNTIQATTRANETLNEMSFEAGLTLAGPVVTLELIPGEGEVLDVDEEVVFFQERLGLRDAIADYLIVSRQSINRRDPVDPVLTAMVESSRIAAEIETATANSQISVNENRVQALVEGNLGQHTINNNEGDGDPTPSIEAVSAIVNWQWVTAPDFTATLVPAEGQATIELAATLLGPGQDAPDDALTAGSFFLRNNVAGAIVNGNRGTASINFSATLMALTLPSETVAGGTTQSQAHLDSDHGATNDGDNFTASAGATIFNYQMLDSSEGNPDGDFLEPALSATIDSVDIVGSVALSALSPASGLTDLALAIDSNLLEARTQGNSFDGTIVLSSLTNWSGSAGASSVQIDNDQSIEAQFLNSNIVMDVSSAAGTGNLDTAALSVFGNRLLSVATVNRANITIAVNANVIEGADWRADYDASDPQSSLSAIVEGYAFSPFRVTRHRSTANGAIAILSDQTADESAVLALMNPSGIQFTVEASNVEAIAADISANTIASQARINDATNSIILQAASILRNGGGETDGDIVLPPGPLATIVSFQGSGRGEIDDVDPERLTTVEAMLTASGISVEIPELIAGSLTTNSNLLVASAAANVANNAIQASAVEIVAGLGDLKPTSEIAFNENMSDYDFSVLAAFTILSSQRNESQQFDGSPRGPDVIADLSNPEGEAAIAVNIENGLESALTTVNNNAVQAVARGNVANNSILLQAVTIEASGHILSRQGNDGDVIANNINGGIKLVLNEGGGGATSDSVATMNGNAIQATAIGNAIVNRVEANALASFKGEDDGKHDGDKHDKHGDKKDDDWGKHGDKDKKDDDWGKHDKDDKDWAKHDKDKKHGPMNGGDPIDGEVSVSASYSVLNSQVQSGTPKDWSQISATVDGGVVALNANGAGAGTILSATDNRIEAVAIANFADNSVTVSAAGGDLPSASVYNRQLNEFSNTTATVKNSGVSVVADGVVAGHQINGGSNSVSAVAIGNSAVNTVSTTTVGR